MQFGFYLPNHGPNAQPGPLAQIAQTGDRLGFYCMVAGDHVLVPSRIDSPYPYTVGGEFPTGESGEYFEQLTLLTFLAGVTENIRMVPSVMIVPYRPPILAAKILATLDVLSQGRLILGVGVGWMEEEFEALGTPPFAERGAVTDEYLHAYKELWTSPTRSSTASTSSSRASSSCPSPSRSRIRPSGSAARAVPPSAAPPPSATAGIPWAPYRPQPWSRRNWPETW